MNDTEQKQDVKWDEVPLLVHTTTSHDCWHCLYKILPGAWATKVLGDYAHYPECPRSAKQNRAIVSESIPKKRRY